MSDGDNLGRQVSGQKPPVRFMLDSTQLDFVDETKVVKEDVKQNRIRFKFPAGFARVSVVDECRAYANMEDFDTIYDLMMGMLDNKDVVIELQHNDGKWFQVAQFHVTDKFMDLRANCPFIDEYPVVVYWMTEFVQGMLEKKFPVPGSVFGRMQAPEDKQSPKLRAKTKKPQ